MQEKDFVCYEYKTAAVKAKDRARAMDMYEAFGWEITSTEATPTGGITISLRRDRKQKHRAELNKLERRAEETFESLNELQRSKTMGAGIFAYIFGAVAALVLGGGMCLVMLIENSIPALVGGIVLGLLGIALCAVNYPIYKRIAAKKTKQVLPVIDETEQKLADILEQGNELICSEII